MRLIVSQKALLACSSLSKTGTLWNCFCPDWHVNECYHYGCLIYIIILSRVHVYSTSVMSEGQYLTTDALVLGLLKSFCLLLYDFFPQPQL